MIKVAVLIPHYNNIGGLEKSLSSISDLEPVDVVVVDDGSKIKPDLRDLKCKFRHINDLSVIGAERNRGIEHALNEGLKLIEKHGEYEYLARLDCGDVCHPERFKIQREFLDRNAGIYLAGSWVSFVDTCGKELFTVKYPVDHEKIKRKMFINNMFIHPSVMFRMSAVERVGYYPTDVKYAEDYAYFFRFVKNLRTANINRVLLTCEVNPSGISLSKRRTQLRNRIAIIARNWEWDIYCFYGLLRNILLFLVPYNVVERMKIYLNRLNK
ncbi:MAG: glycosyltransferase [Nitrospirota bacterium]